MLYVHVNTLTHILETHSNIVSRLNLIASYGRWHFTRLGFERMLMFSFVLASLRASKYNPSVIPVSRLCR